AHHLEGHVRRVVRTAEGFGDLAWPPNPLSSPGIEGSGNEEVDLRPAGDLPRLPRPQPRPGGWQYRLFRVRGEWPGGAARADPSDVAGEREAALRHQHL